MNNVILTTRNTSDSLIRTGKTCGILMSILGLLFMFFYAFLRSHSSENELIFVFLLGAFFFGDGIFSFCLNHVYSDSYMDIFQDKAKGKGIQNLSLLEFEIVFSEIKNISIEGRFIHLYTNCGKYKIISDEDTAKKVFEYYRKNV